MPQTRQTPLTRLAVIDLAKALSAQVIVLHHMVLYSRFSSALALDWPSLVRILETEGRLVVYVFLVASGFLSAPSLYQLWGRQREIRFSSAFALGLGRFWSRLLRLGKPYWFALALAAGMGLLAHHLDGDPEISATVGWSQLLAHLVFLQSVLGYDSLSAGVWYVSVDLQLQALLLFCFMLVAIWARFLGGLPTTGWTVVMAVLLVLLVLSLFWFTQFDQLENWAIYFVWAYALGFLSHEFSQRGHHLIWLVFMSVLMACSLALEWREQVLTAWLWAALLVVYSALSDHGAKPWFVEWPRLRGVLLWFKPGMERLSDWSYAIFVMHYPVLVLVTLLMGGGPSTIWHAPAWFAALLSWSGSLAVGAWVHRRLSA